MKLLLFWLFLLFLLLRLSCSGQSTVRSGTLHNVFDVPVAPVSPTSSTSSSSSTSRDGSSSPLSLVSALIVVLISQGFRQSSLMTDSAYRNLPTSSICAWRPSLIKVSSKRIMYRVIVLNTSKPLNINFPDETANFSDLQNTRT